MAFVTGLRVTGNWKRILLLVPFFAGMCIAPSLAVALSASSWPWWVGVAFGLFLMTSAFTPRRNVNKA
jgi:predicted lysophospholipase L1 biosynthesis ABC-type transport system permease subunit